MPIKQIIGRGIGFGGTKYIPTHGFTVPIPYEPALFYKRHNKNIDVPERVETKLFYTHDVLYPDQISVPAFKIITGLVAYKLIPGQAVGFVRQWRKSASQGMFWRGRRRRF